MGPSPIRYDLVVGGSKYSIGSFRKFGARKIYSVVPMQWFATKTTFELAFYVCEFWEYIVYNE